MNTPPLDCYLLRDAISGWHDYEDLGVTWSISQLMD